jgi:recombination protein RecA
MTPLVAVGQGAARPGQGSDAPAFGMEAFVGRLAELSCDDAPAALTAAFGLVLEAQRQGETAAWVTPEGSCFFPPDAAEGGVDLDALVVVRVPGAREASRAADRLARSGAFGLIVIDLAGLPRAAEVPTPLQSRLLALARRHGIAVVFLTRKRASAPSLGSLVSLRGEARARSAGGDRFTVEVRGLKDKRRAPGWTHAEVCRGPSGLR